MWSFHAQATHCTHSCVIPSAPCNSPPSLEASGSIGRPLHGRAGQVPCPTQQSMVINRDNLFCLHHFRCSFRLVPTTVQPAGYNISYILNRFEGRSIEKNTHNTNSNDLKWHTNTTRNLWFDLYLYIYISPVSCDTQTSKNTYWLHGKHHSVLLSHGWLWWFLEILTYTCPYSGRKRCAVEAGLDSETLQRMRMRLHLVQLIFVFLLVT